MVTQVNGKQWTLLFQGTAFGPLLWNMFQNDMTYHVNVPTLTMRAPNPEKFQSLTINPRNIVAENDDKTLNIDNHEIRKTE